MKLREQIVAWILSGRYGDGDALPSVRSFAAKEQVNPLTAAKAYQNLVELDVIRPRHGIGFFVMEGGAERLRKIEKSRFLDETWPIIAAEVRRLELSLEELCAGPRSACVPSPDAGSPAG
jgi:GntR family transcriptional regulator